MWVSAGVCGSVQCRCVWVSAGVCESVQVYVSQCRCVWVSAGVQSVQVYVSQ